MATADEYTAHLLEVARTAAEEAKIDEDVKPSYLMPSVVLGSGAAVAGGHLSYEQDIIREAYSSANYTSIRELPDRMRAGEVALARELKALELHRPEEVAKVRSRRAADRNHGLFQDFEYIPSPYTREKEIKARERLLAKAKQLEVGRGKDFIAGSGSSKAKYEDCFDPHNYRYPYQSNDIDALKIFQAQERIVHESKVLHGPFCPSGRSARACFDKATRGRLPEIVKTLHNILAADWSDCEFRVATTADDHVAVCFDLVALDGQLTGLRAFMNTLEASHPDIRRFDLRRSGREWNMQPGDGNVYFLFRPPFAKPSVGQGRIRLLPSAGADDDIDDKNDNGDREIDSPSNEDPAQVLRASTVALPAM
ncbi:Hypothetical Protein FCC1311_048982 [Hondaea fermentalgiana]|uniref:Uncharacterized protein n=1 Tax=Hondaea fermentalgiana TaxID=2315210 RepID=A0A2R5GCH3_9STRA|nr:Hypothetical Protein FCC1311_048982 [Hondaea fermentalgiana]|eukprot:GBG28677.1 Hypothetical Protein FCC1311_048982 [Hondaea fermentalgiana]